MARWSVGQVARCQVSGVEGPAPGNQVFGSTCESRGRNLAACALSPCCRQTSRNGANPMADFLDLGWRGQVGRWVGGGQVSSWSGGQMVRWPLTSPARTALPTGHSPRMPAPGAWSAPAGNKSRNKSKTQIPRIQGHLQPQVFPLAQLELRLQLVRQLGLPGGHDDKSVVKIVCSGDGGYISGDSNCVYGDSDCIFSVGDCIYCEVGCISRAM